MKKFADVEAFRGGTGRTTCTLRAAINAARAGAKVGIVAPLEAHRFVSRFLTENGSCYVERFRVLREDDVRVDTAPHGLDVVFVDHAAVVEDGELAAFADLVGAVIANG